MAVNSCFVGDEFSKLSGEVIEHAFEVSPADGKRPLRVKINLTCPANVEAIVFRTQSLELWRAAKIGEGTAFITNTSLRRIPTKNWFERTFGDDL
jgi:hypothetical protein